MNKYVNVITPPYKTGGSSGSCRVFLAGSIEMGKAEMWQDKFAKDVYHDKFSYYLFYNPRREDWDSKWEQDINNPNFYEQVSWELEHLEKSDVVIFYFQPDTMSPISLMELGLVIGMKKKVIVCCPKGFYRKGNVDIMCQRYNIPVFENMDTVKIALYNTVL